MQQTTYGVTPKKTRVFKRNVVDCFLDENQELFEKLKNSQQCLYSDMNLVSDQALNYLNAFTDKAAEEQLKILLKKEFVECEKIYPYLGDFFIYRYFSKQNTLDYKRYLLHSDSKKELINNFKFEEIKECFFRIYCQYTKQPLGRYICRKKQYS